jgi:hypothetical protein
MSNLWYKTSEISPFLDGFQYWSPHPHVQGDSHDEEFPALWKGEKGRIAPLNAEGMDNYYSNLDSWVQNPKQPFAKTFRGNFFHPQCDTSNWLYEDEKKSLSFADVRKSTPHTTQCSECYQPILKGRPHKKSECELESHPDGWTTQCKNHLPENSPDITDHLGVSGDAEVYLAKEHEIQARENIEPKGRVF